MGQPVSQSAPVKGQLVKAHCRVSFDDLTFDDDEIQQMCIGVLLDREWGDSSWKIRILFPAIFHGREMEGEESGLEPLDSVTMAEAIQALENELGLCQKTLAFLRQARPK